MQLSQRTRNQPRTPSPCHTPPRHKLALLTVVGLFAPVYFIPPVVASALSLGRPASVLVSLAVTVPLMSYLIMPALLWLFDGFLTTRAENGAYSRQQSSRHTSPRA